MMPRRKGKRPGGFEPIGERPGVKIVVQDVIAELWRWLLKVTPEEVLALPDLEPGQDVAWFSDEGDRPGWRQPELFP